MNVYSAHLNAETAFRECWFSILSVALRKPAYLSIGDPAPR